MLVAPAWGRSSRTVDVRSFKFSLLDTKKFECTCKESRNKDNNIITEYYATPKLQKFKGMGNHNTPVILTGLEGRVGGAGEP